MRPRLVYNRRSDHGVSVCQPNQTIIRGMCHGGLWASHCIVRGFVETQIELQIAAGIRPDVARRFVHAMTFGGCTTAEALEIIRDRDCRDGYAVELRDAGELPDRWFRDAWRRSHNGGPISIDIKLARPIQWKKMRSAVERENRRRADEFECSLRFIEVDWNVIRERIKAAPDEIALRQIWPMLSQSSSAMPS